MKGDTPVLTTPTLDKLTQLKLRGMARALLEQQEQATYHRLSFEDRLGLLVDRELQDRENRRLHRCLGAARLRASACVEDIDSHHPRGLDRSQILHLVACHWVDAHQQVLIVGPTGAGKKSQTSTQPVSRTTPPPADATPIQPAGAVRD
jgi:DNA replication protein DnaC